MPHLLYTGKVKKKIGNKNVQTVFFLLLFFLYTFLFKYGDIHIIDIYGYKYIYGSFISCN